MMRKKKAGYRVLRRAILFLVLVAFLGGGILQRKAVASFVRNVMLARTAPDALSALRSFQHTTFGVLCAGLADEAGDCFVFDENGVIFNGARTVVGSIVRVSDRSGEAFQVGSRMIDADSWRNIVPIIRFARDTGLDIADFALKRDEQEIDISLTDGPVLRFSYEFDPAQHLRALPVLREKVALGSLEYLDMRVEGKIFYK